MSVNLVGSRGAGKTYLCRKLLDITNGIQVDTKSRNVMLKRIAKHYRCKEKEVYKKNVIVIADNYSNVSSTVNELLIEINAVVIGTSEHPIRRFPFDVTLKIEPLNFIQTCLLIDETVQGVPLKAKKTIYNLSLGYPGDVIRLAKRYSVSKDKTWRFFIEQKPRTERINLLPLSSVFIIGYVLLIGKYLLYKAGSYQDAYIVAIFGYLSLMLSRYKKYR